MWKTFIKMRIKVEYCPKHATNPPQKRPTSSCLFQRQKVSNLLHAMQTKMESGRESNNMFVQCTINWMDVNFILV